MNDAPRGTFESDVARVRLVLMRELETISVYEALAREADSPEAKAFFEHLALEEKEHVAEATYLLRKMDPGQETKFEKAYSEAHFQGAPGGAAAPADRIEPDAPAPSRPAPPQASAPSSGPYIPEELRLPTDPRLTLYALPAPVGPSAGTFTVGPLKPRR